jgi:uncharacterized phage protein gp47/JayE
MQLPLQDFPTLVRTQAAAVSASCAQLIDMTVGSVLRAVLEANASVGLWVQWLIMQFLSVTRAATSNAGDLDTWVADFGMTRLPASAAGGQVAFSRVTAGLTTTIPVGALIRTGTGPTDQVFAVSSDPTNAAWTGAGYQVAAGALSVTVPALAQVPGSAGNVLSGTVVQLATAIPGIDSVTNSAAMAGGLDAETDAALRVRFSSFLDSRTRATAQAVGFAIASVQQGLSYTIAECIDASGAARAGQFTVTVDDGTGSPSGALIAQVSAAVDAVRPIGGTYSVRPPILVPVTVIATIAGTAEAATAAQAAVSAFISALPIGASLMLSRLYQVIHDADPGVTSVLTLTTNSAAADVVPGIFGLIRPNQVSVTV